VGLKVGHWLSNAVRSAGRGIGDAARFVDKEAGKIGKDIDKIPIVGKPFLAFLMLSTPELQLARLATQVLEGQNIAHAVVADLKSALKDVKEVAPYAQLVISYVPGVGSAVSGAIGAGLALAEGQPISQAMIAAVKGAVPGGPLAAGIFGAAVAGASAVASHENAVQVLAQTALAGLPLDDASRTAIASAITLAQKVAQGQNVGQAALAAADESVASLPIDDSAKKALTIGIAMGHGTVTQKAVTKAVPGALDQLQVIGRAVAAKDPVVAAAEKQTKGGRGFEIGIGLMQHAISVHAFQTVRGQLRGDDLVGFDTATSLHVGRVVGPEHSGGPPAVQAQAALDVAGRPSSTSPGILVAAGIGIAVTAILAVLEAPALAAWGTGALVAGAVLWIKR
jgi:hypothetical protein